MLQKHLSEKQHKGVKKAGKLYLNAFCIFEDKKTLFISLSLRGWRQDW